MKTILYFLGCFSYNLYTPHKSPLKCFILKKLRLVMERRDETTVSIKDL